MLSALADAAAPAPVAAAAVVAAAVAELLLLLLLPLLLLYSLCSSWCVRPSRRNWGLCRKRLRRVNRRCLQDVINGVALAHSGHRARLSKLGALGSQLRDGFDRQAFD